MDSCSIMVNALRQLSRCADRDGAAPATAPPEPSAAVSVSTGIDWLAHHGNGGFANSRPITGLSISAISPQLPASWPGLEYSSPESDDRQPQRMRRNQTVVASILQIFESDDQFRIVAGKQSRSVDWQ